MTDSLNLDKKKLSDKPYGLILIVFILLLLISYNFVSIYVQPTANAAHMSFLNP